MLDVLGECGGEYAAGSGTASGSGWFIANPAKFQCTVASDENFQILMKKIFSEISGPGPSYVSLGTI